ncbi:hypothetical protein C5Y97_00270 [Blastopirellula marina]|uniref:Uncharacterized protein n=1 Tax=Blastopirellula marina TaxID=124 RepID=A0A2S8GH99_9BACT|nr:hypothetical protein C5Y98_00270 [Blastopirellula marina]PTL46698.1 hypothetical protein C5Y97_00270 [Blastopirellula marina]
MGIVEPVSAPLVQRLHLGALAISSEEVASWPVGPLSFCTGWFALPLTIQCADLCWRGSWPQFYFLAKTLL